MTTQTFDRWKYAEEAAHELVRKKLPFQLTARYDVEHEEDGETYVHDDFVLKMDLTMTTRSEILDAVAALVIGLGVPVSMQMPLGAALEPWRTLHSILVGFGYGNVDEVRVKLEALT